MDTLKRDPALYRYLKQTAAVDTEKDRAALPRIQIILG